MRYTVVIAPDSFKGSLSVRLVAATIAEGWASVWPEDELVLLPQADGGEGTLDAIAASIPAAIWRRVGDVTGPDGRASPGVWLELPSGVAVVELAQMSGLPLMASLQPLTATTRGLGEVVRAALEAGAQSLVIALGGSASTDGGAGALAALGLKLYDRSDAPLGNGGGSLSGIARVVQDGLLAPPPGGVTLLTDVSSPLLGPSGAAAVFGPQKGASPEQVAQLDAALARFAEVLGGDPTAAGSGAAGGAAFGFASAWGATITSGADYIAELSGLPGALDRADLLITGEGRFDEQSLTGKVVGQLLQQAEAAGVRSAVIAGQVSVGGEVWTASLTDIAGSVDSAMTKPEHWLREAGAQAARDLAFGS